MAISRSKRGAASIVRLRGAGFTLVELLLGLVVLSLVGLAVACMLNAVVYGTDSSRNMRSLVARQSMIATRLNGVIESAHAVLAAEPGVLVLWTHDADGNAQPSADEIERIDMENGQLWAWTAANSAGTQRYALSSDFAQISDSLKQRHALTGQCWGQGVSDWTASVSTTSPTDATLVNWRLTLSDGVMSEVVAQATGLKSREGA